MGGRLRPRDEEVASKALGRYERIARFYDLLDLPFEYCRYHPLRRMLFQGLTGRLLDAGVGTGRKIPFYPAAAEVTGIDLSPAMLRRAGARRRALGVNAKLIQGDVTAGTPIPDGYFDGVVASFLFCVLDEAQQVPALNEIARLCKPDAEVRLLEYALPRRPMKRVVARMWAPWVNWAYGASFERQTEQYLAASALKMVESRFVYGDLIKLIVARPRR